VVNYGSRQTLGRLLAQRMLHVDGAPSREITISIGIPRQIGTYWQCPFLIESDGKSQVQTVGGEDALQALLIAIGAIRKDLEKTGLPLVWMAPELGFDIPQFVPMGYGRRFEQRINRVIEQETKRFWESQLKSRKADIAACEQELQHRKDMVAAWEITLEKRKARAAQWEANMNKQQPQGIRSHSSGSPKKIGSKPNSQR
jgi:hypothetical protein